MPVGTRIGHVHLQVAELEQIEHFYADLLGFEVMVRGYPGALFVAAGGYHHHIGLNTWNSRGRRGAGTGQRRACVPTRSGCRTRWRWQSCSLESTPPGPQSSPPPGGSTLCATPAATESC